MRRLLLLALLATVLGLAVQKYGPDKDAAGDAGSQDVSFLDPGLDPALPPSSVPQQPRASSSELPDELAARAADAIELGSPRKDSPAAEETYTFDPTIADPRELALQLSDCWSAGNPEPLERYLNGAEGKRHPRARRQLIGCFWRAVSGDLGPGKSALAELSSSNDVSADQVQLLRSALGVAGDATAIPASRGASDPLALAMRQVLLDQRAQAGRKAGQLGRAAGAYSELIYAELDAPWASRTELINEWTRTLNGLQDQYRFNPEAPWPSFDYTVQSGDSLVKIRKQLVQQRPGLLLCVGLIQRANGMRSDTIQPDQVLRIPTDTPNAVVDLSERLCLYRQGEEIVRAWTVGIGKEGQETPLGEFVVGEKLPNPSYMPVGVDPVPYGHPDNPLGTRWIGWYRGGEKSSYAFHGTSDPSGMGKRVSQGCIRMRNEDVEELDDLLPLGSRVLVRP